jgi:hypothetical protein
MGTIQPPADVLAHVVDALGRVVALREALADGDPPYAAAIAERLELDLVAWRERLTEAAR